MGGMAAVYAGDEYNTRLKNVGGLSPAKSYYLGESSGTSGWGFRYYAKDIHFAEDADVYLSAGVGEQNGDFLATINRYEQGIAYNDPDVVTKFVAPSGWGNHSWNLAQKEIFMYLHFVTYGTIPGTELVESVCSNANDYTSPTVIYEEEEHTGEYTEPNIIKGYTFSSKSVAYDGESHNITVTAAADATQDVEISYTCNGSAFTGTSEVGTYPIKAKITKSGYSALILSATLTIEPAQTQPADDGEILVDLDLTAFAPSTEAGSSGIVNAGKSKTTSISAYSSDKVLLTTDYLYDKDDLSMHKKVIRLTHNDLDTVISAKKLNKHFEISDPAFEEQDVTLSFWTNADPISKQAAGSAYTAIVQYNAKRDDGTYRNQADGTNSRARLWQYSLDTAQYYYWGNAWGYEITMDNSVQWHHVVMTIPKFEGGAKTVKIYVDGTLGMTQTLSLGGHALDSSFISFGSDENKAYVSTDISFSDIKVYAGAMSGEGVENLYDSEKDFYCNTAYNKVTVSKDGSAINKLTDLSAGDTVTISCNENTEAGVRVFAACYDENGNLISANLANVKGESSFELDIPEGFDRVKIYTWNSQKPSAVQKVTLLVK